QSPRTSLAGLAPEAMYPRQGGGNRQHVTDAAGAPGGPVRCGEGNVPQGGQIVEPVTVENFFLQAEDGIRDFHVTGVQTCALPIWSYLLFYWFIYVTLPGHCFYFSWFFSRWPDFICSRWQTLSLSPRF